MLSTQSPIRCSPVTGFSPLARFGAATGERLVAAAFFTGALLAGGNAVAIRFSNRELAPLWGAGLRFALAALVFLVVMGALRLKIPPARALMGAALYGAFNFGGSFGFAYYALVGLHAGLGQTLLALVPLLALLLAVATGQERLRLSAILGTLIALAGVAIAARAPLQESVPVQSVLAALASAFCFAVAAVVVRRLPPVHPVTMNGVGMVFGAALLLIASIVAGEYQAVPQRPATWLAIAYLVPVGSVLVFGLYLFVLRHWAATRAAYSFVLIPFVTVALSAWLDNEKLGLGLALGGLLVVTGVYVGALRGALPPAELPAH
jgi:drug/metabolite transporter (DMT)-like permease